MKYVLGLDIGITSVGWAALNLDEKRVEGLGVRAFNAAENPKNGASLAEPRRLARSARRRLRRRAGRLRRAKELFVNCGLVLADRRDTAFETVPGQLSPWQLRAEGLDRQLSGKEFARALFHIIKRRGFKSNRKNVAKDKEGKLLDGENAGNLQIMTEHHYRTAGEMYERDEKFSNRKRNTTNSYMNTVYRDLLEDEIRVLFDRQRQLGSPFAGAEFESALLEVFKWQRPYASGDDIIRLIGTCTFETGEPRAARNSYHAERFALLGKANSLTYSVNGDRPRLTEDQRAVVERLAYNNAKVTYAQVRKAAELPDEARFSGLTYLIRPEKDADLEESLKCESATFFELKGYHALRKACSKDGLWEQVKQNPDLMDDLAYALTFYKTDEDIQAHLVERGVDESVIDAVQECGFTKTANLSLMAIKKILPHLEKGLHYSEACAEAGYNHSGSYGGEKKPKLPPIPVDMIRNPVVLRALSQARKVVNNVIVRYGSPYEVHIELARDMGKSAEDRRKIEKRQEENRKEREELEERFRETFKREPNGTDVLKWRLYSEQSGHCAYSMKQIDANRLFEPDYLEIDHILPRSRSFDDGRSNKALVLTGENRNKLNKTPYECFGHDETRWAEYEGWVKAIIRDRRKRDNLLRKNYDERQEKEWKERNLNDTRWIAREFASFVSENLLFAAPENKQPLKCVNGQVVAQARWLWGLSKDREENDLHHAQDAAVIAALVPHQIQMMTEHSKVIETRQSYIDLETGEVIEWKENERPRLPYPWKGFRKEVLSKLPSIMVSRMPQRKVSGAIHEETIRSVKQLAAERISAVKKPLTSLSEKDMKNLFDPEHNERLYEVIRQRMAEYGNNAGKAFAEPLHKPLKDGSPGPVVKGVKVCQTQNTGVSVRAGIADNGDMIRTDVFRKQNKKEIWQYYLVPVYVSDMIAGKLPDRAIVAHKPYEEWHLVDGTYEFLFSLHPYDLVRVGDFLGYYRSCHRGGGSLEMCETNNAQVEKSLGAKSASVIQKYEMGVLGDYYPVHREIRRGLADDSDLDSGEAES